jgi:hypothetical protein
MYPVTTRARSLSLSLSPPPFRGLIHLVLSLIRLTLFPYVRVRGRRS